MFDISLSNDPATALTAGTSSNKVFDLIPMPRDGGVSVRSVAATALTQMHTLKIGHSQRVVKGLRFASTNVTAQPIVIDRHLVRVDRVALTPTLGIADPGNQITYGAQTVIEVPRLGGDTPTHQLIMNELLRIVVLLNPGSNAGLIKLVNGES